MMFEAGEQVECLQAIDLQGFEKIVVRRELFPRNFEVRGREIQDFIESVIGSGQ